ncbi:MAG: hypothetical protein GOMPHAMPRED_002589 [Gomphillus americanus]|uniref:C2H2-type domain-containing protein n=1 Tax=Gomphillus americanus TaxID=1940652 RepID=A0A8H3FIF0_9LECA|nr:MAG: hypothetical protein GOMPHAMPRED_002589 [Gomphillus americanus]
MASYDLAKFALKNYNIKNEPMPYLYRPDSTTYPTEYSEGNLQNTVTLSAVCKENGQCHSDSSRGMTSPLFSWRQGTPEISSYDFAWNRPQTSGMASPLSSHAECSLIEDASNVFSPYIPSTFESTDYTNPNSFPGSPSETWINVDDFGFDESQYSYTAPYSNGSSAALLNITPYPKSQQDLHLGLTLPSQDLLLFDENTGVRKRKRRSLETYPKQERKYHDHFTEDDDDAGSDYTPQSSKKSKSRSALKPTRGKGRRSSIYNLSTSHIRHKTELDQYVAENASQGSIPCPQCEEYVPNKTALVRHVASAHTRLFTCIFSIYGCTSTFGSKNEWKRHVATKHLRTAYWRCHLGRCAPMNPDDQPKDFNRKDLFMQHIRRMHAPSHARDKKEMNASVDDIAKSCYHHVRDPPPQSICGYCCAMGKEEDFSGANAWEYRMEHVGKHLESPGAESKPCVVDKVLEDWLIKEGLIVDNGEGGLILGSLLEDTKGRGR